MYDPDNDPYMRVTRPVAARILGDQSEYRINKAIAEKKLVAKSENGRKFIPITSLDEFLNRRVSREDILGAIAFRGFERTRRSRK